MTSNRCIFLDRDGVLNVDYGYTYQLNNLTLASGVVAGLKKLHQRGFWFIVITNQSGVARGLFSLTQVQAFNAELSSLISKQAPEIAILDFLVCPHHPDGKVPEFTFECDCRKPKPKLIFDAQKKYAIDLSSSWFIGDKPSDMECARNAGVQGVQVTGGEKKYGVDSKSIAQVLDLNQAADFILSRS